MWDFVESHNGNSSSDKIKIVIVIAIVLFLLVTGASKGLIIFSAGPWALHSLNVPSKITSVVKDLGYNGTQVVIKQDGYVIASNAEGEIQEILQVCILDNAKEKKCQVFEGSWDGDYDIQFDIKKKMQTFFTPASYMLAGKVSIIGDKMIFDNTYGGYYEFQCKKDDLDKLMACVYGLPKENIPIEEYVNSLTKGNDETKYYEKLTSEQFEEERGE